MRVMLFVQNEGDKRPKCVPGFIGFDPAEMFNDAHWLKDSGFYMGWKQYNAAYDADRWWLVEAENAEAGRHEIQVSECIIEGCVGANGSILASGGKR